MRTAWMAGAFVMASVMQAQRPVFIYGGAVRVDQSCRIQLESRPGDDAAKPRTKKNSTLCQITKDKDLEAMRPVMYRGVPRMQRVHLMEMEYTFRNPLDETIRFELTYELHKGYHFDPGGGPQPVDQQDRLLIFQADVEPGQSVAVDVAERND